MTDEASNSESVDVLSAAEAAIANYKRWCEGGFLYGFYDLEPDFDSVLARLPSAQLLEAMAREPVSANAASQQARISFMKAMVSEVREQEYSLFKRHSKLREQGLLTRLGLLIGLTALFMGLVWLSDLLDSSPFIGFGVFGFMMLVVGVVLHSGRSRFEAKMKEIVEAIGDVSPAYSFIFGATQ